MVWYIEYTNLYLTLNPLIKESMTWALIFVGKTMHFIFLFNKIQLNEAKCQFSEYSVLKPNQLWWTHDGQRLPPVSFNLNDYLRKFVVKQGFDLTAASEGWNQMLVSSNTDLLWIQQLCLHPYQRLNMKQNGSSSSPLLIDRRFIQLSPLFNGLIGFDEDDWCSRNTVLWDSDEESDKANDTFVHLIHYSIRCERIIYRKHYKFIVQLDLPNSGPVYQCLYFQLVNKNDPIKIINILQSKHVSLHPDESLCDDRAEFDSILWIPSLSKKLNDLFIPCPFVGGFQITSLTRVSSEKPICEYQTFATLESDCVINEGIEWTFDDPKCNIFEVNSISHHNCYASWKKDGLTYTLLHQDRKDDGYSIFTMVFSDIPEPLNPSDYTYGRSKPLWIYPGLSSKHYQYSTLLLDSHSSHFDTTITKNWNDQRTYESPAYRLQIRRAFGICDDEPTSCTKGCDHDIRNRLFCYKSCPVDDKKCKSSQWDSCTFKQNYQGHWNLIESTSNKNYLSSESHKSKWASLIFGENYLIFMGETNKSYLCIREVREVIQDWFIIRSRKQANGCQPRDICLELFQSGIRRSLDSRNTNAMEFRLSQSKKYGSNVKTLCNFESQSFSLNNKAKKSSNALILVRNIEPFRHVCLSAYNIIPVGLNDKRQLILITYHITTKTYYCWIFKEIKQNNVQRYLVFLFDTPQCQYHRLPSGDIQVNEEEAVAHISLTSATCINCPFKSDENSKEYSNNNNNNKLKRPNILRIQTNQLKQQRQSSQRALRQSIQINLKNNSWKHQLNLCIFLILIYFLFIL
ncbi:hypothetical protein Smp_150880 [Schistosoma mansoni]|uniref:hypothetical protein n=1 Tax=Schistosoma mansoni TaxID=6183 RepID=UPI0001A637D5|nr:hypothetical protein Smp_150880 [Schistosoma mansoni]|eukprot:XP_018652000.1 hypothetical protein Smp_150880 [Schistosoma mansoni]